MNHSPISTLGLLGAVEHIISQSPSWQIPTFLLQVFFTIFSTTPYNISALKEQETHQGTRLSPKPRAQQQKGWVLWNWSLQAWCIPMQRRAGTDNIAYEWKHVTILHHKNSGKPTESNWYSLMVCAFKYTSTTRKKHQKANSIAILINATNKIKKLLTWNEVIWFFNEILWQQSNFMKTLWFFRTG